jgi:hypothetical protein
MRPDTPKPDTISVEEMEERLVETARQASIRERLEQITARELETTMDLDVGNEDEEELRTSALPSPSRSPSPLSVEYNEYGIVTACSKGKGRKD